MKKVMLFPDEIITQDSMVFLAANTSKVTENSKYIQMLKKMEHIARVNLKECCELVSLVSTFTFREYNMFAGS
jgi:hypothetical protein